MKSEKYILVVYSIFILSPLLALPFIIYGIYHQYKGCQTALAVFMSLLAFLTAPVGDLFRHTLMYFAMETYSYERFVHTIDFDFIMQFLEYFMAKHNIPFEFLRLAYTFISYSILNYIFNHLISNSDCLYKKSEYFNRYMLTFMSMNFFVLVLGVRYLFATSVFTLGVYYYLCEGKKTFALLFVCLSIFIHYSLFYYGLFIFLFIHIKMNKQTFLFSLILGLIISDVLISQFESILVEQNLQGSSYLGDGKWGKGFKEQLDLKDIIYMYVSYIPCLFTVIYAIKRIKKGRIYVYFTTLALLIAITFSLGSVSGRITKIFYLGIPMLVLWEERRDKRKMAQRYYNAIFYSMVLLYAATLLGMRNPLHHSDYQYIAAPAPIILTHQYDKDWIYQHVNNDGSGKYRDE